MFGMTKRRGLFGGGNGIVATPEQEAESARLAKMLGMEGVLANDGPITPQAQQAPAAPPINGAFGIGGQMVPEPQAPRKSGFFGQGGVGRAIAGTIGDVLLQRGGMAPIYAPTMAFQQRQALEQQQAERERQAKRNDWVWQQEYEAAHPKPEAPDAFERALRGAGIDPASEQGRELYAGRAQAMARDPNDEFVVVPIPGVGTYAGPRSGLGEAMGGGAAPRPVGKLTPISGGPTPQASGTFLDAFAAYNR